MGRIFNKTRLGNCAGIGVLLFLALPLSKPSRDVPPTGPDVIVLLGHSHIEHWEVKSLGGFRIINRGHGGDHTTDLLARFERDVVPIHPRAVVLWAFDNDLMDADRRDIASATRYAETNLLKLVDMAEAHSIQPILTTEVTIRGDGVFDQVANAVLPLFGRSPYQDRINSRIIEGNTWVREQVERRHLLLIDFQRALADSSDHRRPEFATSDGVHLTKQAYAVITAEADAVIRANLRP